MGCISSKLAKKDGRRQKEEFVDGKASHIVFLTSTTYGALNLDPPEPPNLQPSPLPPPPQNPQPNDAQSFILSPQSCRTSSSPEVINATDLMAGLDNEIPAPVAKPANPPEPENKKKVSPRPKKYVGKENLVSPKGGNSKICERSVLKPLNSSPKCLKESVKKTKGGFPATESARFSHTFSQVFDPELVASFERELSFEELERSTLPFPLGLCPPNGQTRVILYTTTLRGIRRTFGDCNKVRSALEEHGVQIIERDISMDSGFREELRVLVGEVKVPMVFVKGQRVGGAEEVLKLEEDGKLGVVLEGIPRSATAGNMRQCAGCGAVRFVVCMDCNGSRKLVRGDKKKVLRCGECNENGLILCPICC